MMDIKHGKLDKNLLAFFLFYFSITVCIQYYFVLVSGVTTAVRQPYTLQNCRPNISSTHFAHA